MWQIIFVESWTKTIKIFLLHQFWHPCAGHQKASVNMWEWWRAHACKGQRGETIDGGEEEEMGKRRGTATSRACAEKQDGCNTTQQRRPAPKLMYASADGRQTVPCRPQIKRAFDKMQKSAKSRITKILLVAFHFSKSHKYISASAQNVSFLELTISSMGPNEINSCDLFQIL